jgi:hypothetical protein
LATWLPQSDEGHESTMAISLTFRPKLLDALSNYTGEAFRRDFMAGLNVMTVAFPLSMAFAIASGVRPEQGLFTAIIGGCLIAALGGSRVQIGGPTGAFVIITYSVLQGYGLNGLLLCAMMAGAMLCVMGFARLGSIIRFIPSPVSRAFTKGIAILILSSQIKNFFGLTVEKLPVDFVGKLQVLGGNLDGIHWATGQRPPSRECSRRVEHAICHKTSRREHARRSPAFLTLCCCSCCSSPRHPWSVLARRPTKKIEQLSRARYSCAR